MLQEVEPRCGEALCRLFPADDNIDITPIARKAKRALRMGMRDHHHHHPYAGADRHYGGGGGGGGGGHMRTAHPRHMESLRLGPFLLGLLSGYYGQPFT